MPRITEMFAFVVEDSGPDDEGVPAIETPRGVLPLMGADTQRMMSLKPFVQHLANQMNKPVRLLKFTTMEEVEVLTPEKPT